MEHKILMNPMTTDEYNDLPLGTTLHVQEMGSYVKVGGWGCHDETLLLNCETFQLVHPHRVLGSTE